MLQSIGLQRVEHDWATELNWRKRAVFQDACAQPKITIFHLGEAFAPTEEFKSILLCIFLEGEPGSCPTAALLFLDCSSLFLHPLSVLISDCLPFETQGRSVSYKQKVGDTGRIYTREGPMGSCWFLNHTLRSWDLKCFILLTTEDNHTPFGTT